MHSGFNENLGQGRILMSCCLQVPVLISVMYSAFFIDINAVSFFCCLHSEKTWIMLLETKRYQGFQSFISFPTTYLCDPHVSQHFCYFDVLQLISLCTTHLLLHLLSCWQLSYFPNKVQFNERCWCSIFFWCWWWNPENLKKKQRKLEAMGKGIWYERFNE